MDEEEVDQLHETLETDYELGCVIKDKIIPRAVAWYTGAAIDPDDDYDEDDDDDYDDDDDGDDDVRAAPDPSSPTRRLGHVGQSHWLRLPANLLADAASDPLALRAGRRR